ncbi:MAG TPA: lytic transglycosylase domain-containing protein [Pyrinomonadaceae bacterium]|jgi:soluble lytic murein transglycosylase-like protein|nr:lytic transglycosylase domain-containing protein [Pyrinomonadaceae bacterium]
MKFPRRLPHFRSLKFAPFAVFSLFLFTNLTGVLFSRALAPSAAASTEFRIPADIPTSGDPQLDRIIFEAAEEQGVDPRLLHAVIWQESKYKTDARSHAGAQGLMQLIPDTAKRFGCNDPNDPAKNIEAGAKYLSWLLKRFSGNVELALAGYNAGEGAVDKYDGIPPYNETQNYVKIISKRYGKTYHPVLPPAQAAELFHLHAD